MVSNWTKQSVVISGNMNKVFGHYFTTEFHAHPIQRHERINGDQENSVLSNICVVGAGRVGKHPLTFDSILCATVNLSALMLVKRWPICCCDGNAQSRNQCHSDRQPIRSFASVEL
jgi:hypothetical protein